MSVAACTLTAIWQFARLPNAPQDWQDTPTEVVPHLGNDTSSTTHTAGQIASPNRSAIRRHRVMEAGSALGKMAVTVG
ncbi:hypothetical protein BFF78_00705 [Streptomyces fodineus]|uniref:Uncharacterized protein n=1 Tax=Streptomyces fodineus TaxID=1904616 RepID=A0A1D7Y2K8_9ACTN|nr:hypothetical protein BFF78_00705 [Streptomyces fodineus]